MDSPTNNFQHSTKKQFIATLFVWLAAVLIFFAPSVIGGKIIAPLDCLECLFRPVANKPIEQIHNQFVVDSVLQYLPYKEAIQKSLVEDGYIGWNPYTHNGNAIAENTMASPGDVLNYLYAILPFWTAWDLGVILQFFLAGIGMILLLRFHKIPMWGCLLGAISFAFYSQFILWMYHKWVGAMIWGPFLVWALLRFKRNIINVPAIIFMALAWRTGHLQACTFAFILVALVWLAEIWKKDGKWLSWQDFGKITLSYFLTGVIGALLSLDVFIETTQRMEGCKDMPFSWGINNLPSIGTLLFPHILGTPQTHDVFKIFRLSLFDIKYGGSLVFILALTGCFNARAPRVAKVLFIGSFLLACTPLLTYIYSRSTVVMGLGMAWLATWQVYDFTQNAFRKEYLKRIGYALGIILALWLAASIIIFCFRDSLETLMKAFVNKSTAMPSGRIAWQELRVERFLDQIVLWHWRNLLFAGGIILGLFCCYKIKPAATGNTPWITGICLITYAEMLLFSSVWITYSDKPEGSCIYNAPSWLAEAKAHIKDGSVTYIYHSGDRDFLINNQLSSYGIRLVHGYETFQPQYLGAKLGHHSDTKSYAAAGVSHIICDTKWKEPNLPGWDMVMTGKDFKLYANPDYKGRYFIDSETPITANWRTCNRIQLTIPAGSKTLTVLESYHKGWKAYAGTEELVITPTEPGGMIITLPATTQATDVLLEFRMPYRWWYYTIMIMTALGLIIAIFKQKKKN